MLFNGSMRFRKACIFTTLRENTCTIAMWGLIDSYLSVEAVFNSDESIRLIQKSGSELDIKLIMAMKKSRNKLPAVSDYDTYKKR